MQVLKVLFRIFLGGTSASLLLHSVEVLFNSPRFYRYGEYHKTNIVRRYKFKDDYISRKIKYQNQIGPLKAYTDLSSHSHWQHRLPWNPWAETFLHSTPQEQSCCILAGVASALCGSSTGSSLGAYTLHLEFPVRP